MKKKIIIVSVSIICLAIGSFIYLQMDDSKQVSETYLQTLIYQDANHDLVPVSLNVHNQMELETDIRNKIDLMQSSQLQAYGLYPVIDSQLEVQSVELQDHMLTVSFNDCLYSNQDALNIIEALTYVLTDYDDVNQLKIQIDGKDVTYLPNSTVPLNHLTHDLGLNNFEEASTFLHQSVPVMVYQEKTIADYLYYVPTTLRISESDSLEEQVRTILSHINSKIHLLNASLDKQVLTLELDSNLLLDNERIDKTLEELIILSLTSLDNVKDVDILINGESVRNQETSQIHYNYIKI